MENITTLFFDLYFKNINMFLVYHLENTNFDQISLEN